MPIHGFPKYKMQKDGDPATSCFTRCPTRQRILLLLTLVAVVSVYNLSQFFTMVQQKQPAYTYHETNPPPIRTDLRIDSELRGTSVEEQLHILLNESTYDVTVHIPLLEWENKVDPYPKALMQTNWTNELPVKESFVFSNLQRICLSDRDVILRSITSNQIQMENSISHAMVYKNYSNLLSVLKECPAIDIYIPEKTRGNGYCEDAVAYIRGLNTRLLPRWVLHDTFYDPAVGKNLTYFEICPSTGLMFFNHYWDNFTKLATWPKKKPIYLMPNTEMYELTAEHLWQSDVVLTKTVDAYQRTTKWFQQNGNPRNTVVFYTRHTTTNVLALDSKSIDKDFDNVRLLHTPGASWQKNTVEIALCWKRNPSLPLLEIFGPPELLEWEDFADSAWRLSNHSNYKLYTKDLSSREFSKLLARTTFFLCPSRMEGYGHYINQARAAGGVILTTNAPPMNELITSTSGVLVPFGKRRSSVHQLLGGNHNSSNGLKNAPGIEAIVKPSHIREAVYHLLSNTSVAERKMMAQEAKRQYAFDTNFFLYKMEILQAFASQKVANAELSNDY
uniref:Uncharacterized protein AlNc14C140G7229 n=1 Tax=Albugo laibachii Nc14 TaxID=890382 RepID=F0WL42_9STRA|nr:conserved hypothetical protein [Albugo laibachii Nc14]|eukprot:CCA22002.1 conserved hypothetical protein [Albugo laibachii Nc14]